MKKMKLYNIIISIGSKIIATIPLRTRAEKKEVKEIIKFDIRLQCKDIEAFGEKDDLDGGI